jgi:hypothetical protein
MVTRHGGVASSYDCCYCECPAAYNYSVVVPADACPLIVPTDDQMHDQMWFAPPCGGSYYYYDATSWVNWSSSNTSIFTLNSSDHKGLLTGHHAGTASAFAQGSSECRSWYQMGGSCLCSQYSDPYGYTSCSVVAISGPQTKAETAYV